MFINCPYCGDSFEVWFKTSEDSPRYCPKCGEEMDYGEAERIALEEEDD
jgi:putative FmdB family regulatory protein